MSQDYMVTMPREGYEYFSKIMAYFRKQDIKKWIIGAEEGKTGYKHWQIRFRSRIDNDPKNNLGVQAQKLELVLHGWFQGLHIEPCSDAYEYEGKEGKFLASWDTMDNRKIRFGKPRWYQKCAIDDLWRTNDREIKVWYDPKGNCGKSWLVGHLYETGQAYYLPPYMNSVNQMIQTLASMVIEDRNKGIPPRPLVLIDIPRSWKWTDDLYVAIESIKDGLIMDPRYSARPVHCRGLKVLVMTNVEPKMKKISADRWKITYTPGEL